MEGLMPNIIFIVLDTMRKDLLYDNLDLFPNIKDLIGKSVKYENCHTVSSWTVPSHASLFTGLYPSEHGIHYYYDHEVFFKSVHNIRKLESPIISNFRSHNYNTLAISSNIFISSDSPFANFFDKLISVGPYYLRSNSLREWAVSKQISESDNILRILKKLGPGGAVEFLASIKRMKKQLNSKGFPRVKGGNEVVSYFKKMLVSEPFFVFLNFMEAHEPYSHSFGLLDQLGLDHTSKLTKYYLRSYLNGVQKNDSLNSRKFLEIKNRLFESIKILDGYIGEIIDHLINLELYDDSLIVLTSDHGQSFGENTFFGHSYFLHNAITDVPLVIKYPAYYHEIGKSDQLTSLIDIPEFFKSVISNDKRTFPSRKVAFAESYGLYKASWLKNAGSIGKFKSPEIRKRVWLGKSSLTVNGSKGIIEEFTNNGKEMQVSRNEDLVRKLLLELELFVGNEDFRLPYID